MVNQFTENRNNLLNSSLDKFGYPHSTVFLSKKML